MTKPLNDTAADEHLRTALRHAPDAGLTAPPELGAQIIAAAYRAAAEPAPMPSPVRAATGFGRWRLAVPGAFAAVLVASVTGLLWHGERPAPLAPADLPLVAPTTPLQVAQAPAEQAPAAALRAAATAPGRPIAVAKTQAEPAKAVAREPAHSEVRAAPAPAPAQVKDQAPAQAQAQAAVAAAALQPLSAPHPAAPPPTAGAARTATALAPQSADTPAAAMRAAPRPVAPWMEALAAGSAVQWRVDGQPRAPSSSWLYALAEQTRGAWRAASGPAAAGAREVQWLRDGALQGRLWLGADSVLWCDAQARCEQAPLPPDVAATLSSTLSAGLLPTGSR